MKRERGNILREQRKKRKGRKDGESGRWNERTERARDRESYSGNDVVAMETMSDAEKQQNNTVSPSRDEHRQFQLLYVYILLNISRIILL